MRLVMTGGTSGIGLVAARRLLSSGARLVIGARRPERAPADLRGAEFEPLDLVDVDSVRSFAERVTDEPIDVFVGNAGLQVTRDQRTEHGLEVTFAANHLAHHWLVRRLVPAMAEGGRIVLTSSGTHDPELKTGMPAPHHADAFRLARPETDPQRDADPGKAGRRAYSSSKLANVMTVVQLARRLSSSRPDLAVAAFDPGFTPGTGLARAYPGPANFVFRRILPLVLRGDHVSTPERSGELLAVLATDAAYASARGDYFSVRSGTLRRVEPSTLARDAVAGERLWADSEALTGPA